MLWHASLAHAQRYILCRIFPRPSAIASDRRGPQEPSETRMAGAYRASEWRWSGHLVDHDQDRKVQNLCVALAGAVHARRRRRTASRQVASARQGSDPARSCRRDRPPDTATAAARSNPLDAARDGEDGWRCRVDGPGDLEGARPQPASLDELQAVHRSGLRRQTHRHRRALRCAAGCATAPSPGCR